MAAELWPGEIACLADEVSGMRLSQLESGKYALTARGGWTIRLTVAEFAGVMSLIERWQEDA